MKTATINLAALNATNCAASNEETRLDRLKAALISLAQADANQTGKRFAILNLNPYSPLYVIREWKDTYRDREELIAKVEPRTGDFSRAAAELNRR